MQKSRRNFSDLFGDAGFICGPEDPQDLPGELTGSRRTYSQILGNLGDLFFSVLGFSSAKNGAKELKNHEILDWCKGKNVKLEKR